MDLKNMKIGETVVAATASFGSDKEFSYAVNIDGLDSNSFYTQSFGRQMADLKKVQSFIGTAKTGFVGAKGKSTMAAVKAHIKEHGYKNFYAKWPSDSSSYKDDSVKIYYK